MAYDIPWGSTHPGLLVYLVDLSGSMAWDDKIRRVSKIVWEVVDSLVAPCQHMGTYRDRFHLAVIGYNQYTYDIFTGDVNAMLDKLDATEKSMMFFDIEKEGKAQGLTHMSIAYEKAAEIIRRWISSQKAKNMEIPAPVVINITDGYPEEKNMTEAQSRDKALRAARELQNISVPDGNVLLFNIHIDGAAGAEPEMKFPVARPSDPRRGFLYDVSTELNDVFVSRAQRAGLPAAKGCRFMVSNVSDPKLLSRLVVFGSSVSGLTRSDGRCEVPIP